MTDIDITEADIQAMLDGLANLQAKRDEMALQRQAAIDAIMTQEIREKLAEIDAAYSQSEVAEQIESLTASVKIHVTAMCHTVKGSYLQAVWSKGRESWDGKLLAGFALAHPEILTARKIGEPSVAIRGVK